MPALLTCAKKYAPEYVIPTPPNVPVTEFDPVAFQSAQVTVPAKAAGTMSRKHNKRHLRCIEHPLEILVSELAKPGERQSSVYVLRSATTSLARELGDPQPLKRVTDSNLCGLVKKEHN